MKILVLAGGSDQIALINELKSRGHYVILVDYYENPPAKVFADKHIVASTLDVDRVEQIAISESVEMICTACTDQALLTVSYVSEKLGLPCYLNYQTGLNVTNKSYMKSILVNNDIPTSKYIILDSPTLDKISGFRYPLIVKPVDCNSSKGVKRADNEEEVIQYLTEALSFSRTGTAIVEEFKEGKEISADFYIENGVAKYLSATSSIKIPNKNSFTILCSEYPAIDSDQEKELVLIATKISKAFSLDNTPLLIQLIVNNDEMNVIEFSARMGGGSKYKLVETLSGVNIMSKYVDRILGHYPAVTPSKQVDYCKMVYVYCNTGIFDHVEGLDELKEDGLLKYFFIYKSKGMEIVRHETSGDRVAGYMVTAESIQELEDRVNYINNNIRVISFDGKDMMLHNLLQSVRIKPIAGGGYKSCISSRTVFLCFERRLAA